MLAALPTALHHLQRYYQPTDILSSNFHVGLPYEALAVSCLFILQVINDRFGIVEGLMTTVHSITGRFSASRLVLDFLSYYLVPNSFFSC